MTELQLLAEQIGANERTLRRACNDGTLRAVRESPRKLKLGAAEKQYLRRSWKLLAALRKGLRTEQNVRFALLFGSAARGEDTASSDIDLLVEMRDPSLIRVSDLGAKLEALVGRRVDVLPLGDARSNPQLLTRALDEGRVLVDREERWALLRGEAGALQRHDRWQGEIVEHLEDFPRQYAALENAMAGFGAGFDLQAFKAALESTTNMDSYNRAQAVERGLGRVQNYVAQLSITGAKLAGLQPPKAEESAAVKAFEALRDAGVLSGALCRKLRRAQNARTMIEHSYVKVPAGNVHQAAELIVSGAREFIGPYRNWVEAYL